MFRNALVSVSDKTGLLEFIKPLAANGTRIVSTGGTAKFLSENGVNVVQVSEQTGFPEVMDGRVRTLHPLIHMALLGRRTNAEDMALLSKHGIEPFDLVVGSLYPFEEQKNKKLSDEELIEYIDIGGPALLRAASKNFAAITVVSDPSDYKWIVEKGETTIEQRRVLAAKVFSFISTYDSMVAEFLANGELTKSFSLAGERVQELRYGENPQQKSFWYKLKGAQNGLHKAQILQGKALSYNNILDLEAAIQTLRDFEKPTVVAVKHNNSCGVSSHKSAEIALSQALKADPVSVFGGIVALNFELDLKSAQELSRLFLECVVAPSVSIKAEAELKAKKNLRVLVWPEWRSQSEKHEIKTVSGGFLIQDRDQVSNWNSSWQVIGEKPNEQIKHDIEFAWKICKHLKSNAIAIAENETTLGLGMGQVNRVEAVEHAIQRMKAHHPNVKNAVLASDAFFPFADSIEKIANAGIRWVIQPGGSVKDQEVIERARALNVNLVMTGVRHFKH